MLKRFVGTKSFYKSVLFLLINTLFTAITGKKINPKYEGYIHAAAMVLLLGLMAVLLVKDVLMIARR